MCTIYTITNRYALITILETGHNILQIMPYNKYINTQQCLLDHRHLHQVCIKNTLHFSTLCQNMCKDHLLKYVFQYSVPSGPTASPIFSTATMYVTKSGVDANDCIMSAPCLTINYAYDCLHDDILHPLCNIHHGNGIIDMDGSNYYLERLVSIGNANLRIFGHGMNSILYMNLATPTSELTWFECTYWKCWIGLEDLVLASDRTSIENEWGNYGNKKCYI